MPGEAHPTEAGGFTPGGHTETEAKQKRKCILYYLSIKNKRGSVYIYPRAMHHAHAAIMQPAAMVVAAAPHGLPLVPPKLS